MLNADQVHLFEEHSSTLPAWWEQGKAARTVVYLDAHLDLQQVSPAAIEALEACSTIDEVKALETPHHLDHSPAYAYGIENFLYAASRLGLIERLIWVAPPHIPRNYSPETIHYMEQMDGISFDELTGFEEIGPNTLRGKLLGLDITICDYDRLASLDLGDNYYLDIDIDYFVKVPEDRLWIEPAMVISKIVDQLGEPSLVTISRAVGSGFTPLAFRYIGDYIYSRFCRQTDRLKYYSRLSSAIQKLSRGKTEKGRQVCEELTVEYPEIAAGWYLRALVGKGAAEKNRLLERAAECDENYRPDLARDGIGLLHRRKRLEQKRLQGLLRKLDCLELPQAELEVAETSLALTLAAAGDIPEAQRLLQRQKGTYANHDDVMLLIVAASIGDRNRCEENRKMLTRLCEGYKNVTVAQMYLGELESDAGNHEAAMEHYRQTHSRAPAWMAPLKAMLVTSQQLLMQKEYDQIKEEIRRREQRLRELLVTSRFISVTSY